MSGPDNMANRLARFQNRLYARLSQRQSAVRGFVSQPEPRTIGSFARGRQLLAGNLLFAGYLVESSDHDLWSVKSPSPAFDDERHGFTWLDDLAAVGDSGAREKAQMWLWGWIEAHGAGRGPGWTPELSSASDDADQQVPADGGSRVLFPQSVGPSGLHVHPIVVGT